MPNKAPRKTALGTPRVAAGHNSSFIWRSGSGGFLTAFAAAALALSEARFSS